MTIASPSHTTLTADHPEESRWRSWSRTSWGTPDTSWGVIRRTSRYCARWGGSIGSWLRSPSSRRRPADARSTQLLNPRSSLVMRRGCRPPLLCPHREKDQVRERLHGLRLRKLVGLEVG